MKVNWDFKETVEVIITSASDNNSSLPHQYDVRATMKKHGFDVKLVTVFPLCKPEHAYEILKVNNERLASAIMPFRKTMDRVLC